MIRVTKIEVHEFRGIRKLALDLKGENFAVCGPNGTGKSGIVDALEFALTGNISRLSGSGTGGLSVKAHGPHVDSRNKPEQAYVSLTLRIPSLGKDVVLKRDVQDANSPTITPCTPDVMAVLKQVALHPEFVLSRRELIRYVLSEPGKRSKEVQALLRLDEVESLRTILQRIANAAGRSAEALVRTRRDARGKLTAALSITELSAAKVLDAVNARRATLSLPALAVLESTTSLKDGIATVGSAPPVSRVRKAQSQNELEAVASALEELRSKSLSEARVAASTAAQELLKDAALLSHVSREDVLRSALDQFDGERCPVCDTEWGEDAFKAHIATKLEAFRVASEKRALVEAQCKPILAALDAVRVALQPLISYGPLLTPPVSVESLRSFRDQLTARINQIGKFLPLDKTIEALDAASAATAIDGEVEALKVGVNALPEPSAQDAALEFLIIAQEKLDAYRSASQDMRTAQEQAAKASKVCEVFADTTTIALDAIYKRVETAFGDLYREINKEDESTFTAHLKPSLGRLGFDVDFYGRGHFPPGAYHSEGHQDGMGVCLYLALMSHLLGNGFTFAVLDDVLMSVDAGHRREVCTLLRTKFPNTQFILTTHDEIWLRHMRTVGLIKGGGWAHFRKWTVDQGPTEWDDRDVWQELDGALAKNDVQRAAATLRHYFEYFAGEVCHRLRARVEFRGDHQFVLGDLLPNAVSAMGDLLKKAKAAANSWGNKEEMTKVAEREAVFLEARQESNVDQWQINAAVHYNEWASSQKNDFKPVVQAFRKLVDSMCCSKCEELLYVLPERGDKEALRCACAEVNINLVSK